MMIVKKKLLEIVNVPFIWNALQALIGANQWKQKLYPSVIRTQGRLLDFGCSTGNVTSVFTEFDYFGVDIDSPSICFAKKQFAHCRNVRFASIDILKKQFKKNFFDHVLFACVGHHLTSNELQKILPILLDSLRQNGELHFFDSISQPEKDRLVTKFFILVDQGKNIRTIPEHEHMFSRYAPLIAHREIFTSPQRLFIKLPDLIYIRLTKA